MATVEASIEGPIQSVAADPTGVGADIVAMGVTIRFIPGTTASGRTRTIKTPTKTLTPAEFRSSVSFPGRAESGFVGGTVIAEGEYDTDANLMLADFLQVEPAETVLLGALTQNTAGTPRQIRINGVPIAMLTDVRMPANPDDPATPIFMNQYGFPFRIETAVLTPTGPTPNPPTAPSSVEGYFAGNVFHAFLFEYGGTGTLVRDPVTTPQISMERAAYRDEGTRVRFEARGFVTSAHAGGAIQNVELFRVDLDPATGALQETPVDSARVEIVEAGFQRWRVEFRGNKPGGFMAGVPLKVIVKNHSGPASAELEPDVREP
jgi:hypothetical protein